MLTTDQILYGIGLTVALAVGSQVLASRLRIPAILVLLPVGFTAGALTDDVDPHRLLGPAFPEMVSLAVALILYDAGVALDMRQLSGSARRSVRRLILLGVVTTVVATALAGLGFLGLSGQSALMLGVILVVSGPTVVEPLLRFVRPVESLQRLLTWEGSLIDPVGGVLGALVFHALTATSRHGLAEGSGRFGGSLLVGLAGGALGAAVLWLLLTKLRLDEAIGTAAQLATVVAVAAACDALRDDTGLIAAIVVGLVVGNSKAFDVPTRQPFFETLIQLILGLLFVSISATVTPDSLHDLVLPTLGLLAVLALLARPLAAWLATVGTGLSRGERLFVGWMAPRGIVAAATASTFSAGLVDAGVGGSEKILPITFLIIVGTVALYGLTAAQVARRLGVVRSARARPLLVGDDAWAVDLGIVLRAAGLDVLLWAAEEPIRERARAAGLEVPPGELLAAAAGRRAQLEGITAVFLLTESDDFNALASTVLRPTVDGPVHRLRPERSEHGVVSPYTAGQLLFAPSLTRDRILDRYADGARVVLDGRGELPPQHDLLFVVRADGRLIAAEEQPVPPEPGDRSVLLGPGVTQPRREDSATADARVRGA